MGRLLALSTVNGQGRLRVSAVDGHLLRAQWVFTTRSDSVRAHDLRRNPGVSEAHLEGEEFGVFTHGDATVLLPGHPDLPWICDHFTHHYGRSPSSWGPAMVYLRIQPRWLDGFLRSPP
jgi:hypothetical protein